MLVGETIAMRTRTLRQVELETRRHSHGSVFFGGPTYLCDFKGKPKGNQKQTTIWGVPLAQKRTPTCQHSKPIRASRPPHLFTFLSKKVDHLYIFFHLVKTPGKNRNMSSSEIQHGKIKRYCEANGHFGADGQLQLR